MKSSADFQKYHHREDFERILLKALIWKSPLTKEILKIVSPLDFSPQNRRILNALLNMIDFGIDIKMKTLEEALEGRLDTPLFDNAPNEADIIACIELIRQKSLQRTRALKQISEWKKAIDDLTIELEEQEIEPEEWVENVLTLFPYKEEDLENIDIFATLDQIRGWKKIIDTLTIKVERGELEPHKWVEGLFSLFPQREEPLPDVERETPKEPAQYGMKKPYEESPTLRRPIEATDDSIKRKIEFVRHSGKGTTAYTDKRPTKDLTTQKALSSPQREAQEYILQELKTTETPYIDTRPTGDLRTLRKEQKEEERQSLPLKPIKPAETMRPSFTEVKKTEEPISDKKQGREQAKPFSQLKKHLEKTISPESRKIEGKTVPKETEENQDVQKLILLSKDTPGALEPEWSEIIKDFQRGKEKTLIGLSTGMEELDEKSMGLRGLIIMAGMPKMGKTTFALQIATEVARLNNALSIFYSLEMDRKTLLYRILSRISKIPYKQIVLGKESNLKEREMTVYEAAKREFEKYKNNLIIFDRTTTEIDTEKIFYQIEGLVKKTKKEKTFIVIDSLPSFSFLDQEAEKTHGGKDYMEKILSRFRFIQQIFDSTILLVYPKNFIPLHLEQPETNEDCYELIYPVDSFFELYPKAEKAKSKDYYSELSTDEDEIDLWATTRDSGRWFVPLTFSKPTFTFSGRKRGFKATKITWIASEEEEPARRGIPGKILRNTGRETKGEADLSHVLDEDT